MTSHSLPPPLSANLHRRRMLVAAAGALRLRADRVVE